MRVPRFTTRTLMVIVAILAVILAMAIALKRRRDRFDTLAHEHFRHSGPVRIRSFEGAEDMRTMRSHWHNHMYQKYMQAARTPWLPVERDPPMPEAGEASYVERGYRLFLERHGLR